MKSKEEKHSNRTTTYEKMNNLYSMLSQTFHASVGKNAIRLENLYDEKRLSYVVFERFAVGRKKNAQKSMLECGLNYDENLNTYA